MSLVSKVICDVCGSESGVPDKPSTWGAQGKVEIRFGGSYYLASSHVDLCKRCYREMQDQLRDWLASMPPCFRGVKTPATEKAVLRQHKADIESAGTLDIAAQAEALITAVNKGLERG